MVADDCESMEETDYLLRSPANAARLLGAAEHVRARNTLVTEGTEELSALAERGEDG